MLCEIPSHQLLISLIDQHLYVYFSKLCGVLKIMKLSLMKVF